MAGYGEAEVRAVRERQTEVAVAVAVHVFRLTFPLHSSAVRERQLPVLWVLEEHHRPLRILPEA